MPIIKDKGLFRKLKIFDFFVRIKTQGRLAQLVRASRLHREGLRFESSSAQLTKNLAAIAYSQGLLFADGLNGWPKESGLK